MTLPIPSQWITNWKAQWALKQSRQSQYPLAVWEELAALLIRDRLPLKNNPFVPLGNLEYSWPGVMEFLVDRNNRGIELEKRGEIDTALMVFELSIADAFHGTHPYDRLRIHYTKRGWYLDAIRVCQSYLDLPGRPGIGDKPRFKDHIEKLKKKSGPSQTVGASREDRV